MPMFSMNLCKKYLVLIFYAILYNLTNYIKRFLMFRFVLPIKYNSQITLLKNAATFHKYLIEKIAHNGFKLLFIGLCHFIVYGFNVNEV